MNCTLCPYQVVPLYVTLLAVLNFLRFCNMKQSLIFQNVECKTIKVVVVVNLIWFLTKTVTKYYSSCCRNTTECVISLDISRNLKKKKNITWRTFLILEQGGYGWLTIYIHNNILVVEQRFFFLSFSRLCIFIVLTL